MMEVPEHEWDGEALAVARDHDRSIGNARDLVIMDWLIKGDTRPLSDWLLRGHVPDTAVMKAVAVMLVRGHPDADQRWFSDPAVREVADVFTLRLEVAGKGKRGRDPAIVERDKRIALEVAREMARGSSLEKACEVVAEWLVSIDYDLGTDAVAKAYKNHKHLISGTNSR